MKGINIPTRQPRRDLRAWLSASWLATGAAGALAMYFLDPDRGRRRRRIARDRLGASLRRGWRALGRAGRRVTADTYGLAQQAQHAQPEHWSVPNDATLAQRVETEVFRGPGRAARRGRAPAADSARISSEPKAVRVLGSEVGA
jgi:hypothetical protein